MNIISFVLLILIGIAILGPDKLPNGLEFLWLNVTNFLRTQNDEPVLDLEEARIDWKAKDSPIFTVVELLRAASEHLLELRRRIFSILIAMGVFFIGAVAVSERLLYWLTLPAGDVKLIALRPTEMFMLYVKVILAAALALTIPFIVYHLLRFVEPALETPKEKKIYTTIVRWAIPFSGFFFLGGAAFAYFVMLPFALSYLGEFGTSFAEAQWDIHEYASFAINMILWVGLAFETPLAMFVLAKADLIPAKKFAEARRFAYVGVAIMAAVITPTPDAFNMILVMVPLVGLYELGVLLAKLA